MKSDKLRINILVSFSLLSRNVWLSVQLCSFLPLNQWRAALKKRSHGENTMLEMLFMPQTDSFAADKAATLFSLVWPQTAMNPASAQRSPSSQNMAPWFASPTLFRSTKSVRTAHVDAGALWDCLLTSRILRLVMRAGFQPATSFLFLKYDWYQSSSETSFTVREAGSTDGSSVCQEHVGAWGKITLT